MNTASADVTPHAGQIAELAATMPCTRGWRLRHRGGNFYEIHAPHPEYPDQPHYRQGIADITAPLATALHLFAAIVAAGSNGLHGPCSCPPDTERENPQMTSELQKPPASPNATEVFIDAGQPFCHPDLGLMPGYVAGTCGHRVAQSEWNAGLRTCERC